MIERVQNILERNLSPKEYIMLQDLMKDYNESDILLCVYYGKFKDRPIDYARGMLINKYKKKDQPSETDSEWLNNLKNNLK